MRKFRLVEMRAHIVPVAVFLAVLASTSTANGTRSEPRGDACRPRAADAGYARRVERALRARTDVWGNALLRARNGPTYEAARRYLEPLHLARGPEGKPLTKSGFQYLAFAQPGVDGSGSAALHVADGSQIISRRAGGPSLTIGVGRNGRERYGSCLARLTLPRLAAGYLPILETKYVDGAGARYEQESFAVRTSRAAPLTSFVRIRAEAFHARGDVEVRLAPGNTTVVIPSRAMASVYVSWPQYPSGGRPVPIDRATYDAARARVVDFWEDRLREGATIDVPEPRVRDAARNLLVQNLGLGWRYSVGNPYQQFSFPESIDVAEVLSSFGFSEAAVAIMLRSLSTPRGPYPSWRAGQKLVGTALHYRLFRDRDFVNGMTPALREYVVTVGRQLGRRGILGAERYSSDIPDLVYGLHSQAVVWQGLRAMGGVWGEVGQRELAGRCRRLARALQRGLRTAIADSRRELPDGSLFVPVRLYDRERPYGSVTESRLGSYWNLVAPYAFSSGLLEPHSLEAKRVLEYVLEHGSRLLGLVRAGAYSLYGRNAEYPASGVNPVYGLNVARFLADNDLPDQLVLSLYGQLAAGMSPGTFVSGEAASVAPLPGDVYRSAYLPPNGASNASFLETLRLMLAHETFDRRGVPNGLELAYATPRAWLEPGKTISVRDLPTSFGPVSFSIESRQSSVRVSIDVPNRARPRVLNLRLRLPRRDRIAGATVAGDPLERLNRSSDTFDLSRLTGSITVVAYIDRG